MLQHLRIKNYALIRELEMNPDNGLNTITGETGAGKSIMLGAIGLLTGNRADSRVLLNQDSKCVIEGEFEISEYKIDAFFQDNDLDYSADCIIRREINTSGKSRAFVNDTPVNLDLLKELGSYLIDIHSQSDTALLGKSNFQLKLIDAFAETENLRNEYAGLYSSFKAAEKELDELETYARNMSSQADYNKFLYEELENANFSMNEQDHLEEEQRLLEHAEEIKRNLLEAIEILNNEEQSVIGSLQHAKKDLDQISKYSETFNVISERIQSSIIELQDVISEIEREEEHVEVDEEKQVEINDRLSLLYNLLQKHNAQDISQLISLKDDLDKKVRLVENMDDKLELARNTRDQLYQSVIDSASALSQKRQNCFESLSSRVEEIITELGMPFGTVVFNHIKTDPGPNGADDIRILFSANRGIEPEELKNVASGGEFSRLMFAIKSVMAQKSSLPTIIFDEIDTGVSGEVALKLAKRMLMMSANHQVITITHLPQIASHGNRHFYVYKDESSDTSVSKMKVLDENGRVSELAKMIGGENPTENAITSARELLMHH